jgi:hypothetical protein
LGLKVQQYAFVAGKDERLPTPPLSISPSLLSKKPASLSQQPSDGAKSYQQPSDGAKRMKPTGP